MPTFNSNACLTAMRTFLQSAPLVAAGLQRAYIGSPERFDNRANAYVALLGASPRPAGSGGAMTRRVRLFVGIGYRLQGAEETTELAVATVLDSLQDTFFDTYPDRDLGGVLEDVEFEEREDQAPLYQRIGTSEFRIMPVVLAGTQTKTFALS